jgi:predicted nucleic acid-binding protein
VTFFVDAKVIVYAAMESEYRGPCLQVLEAVASGESDGRTSAAVLEEVWFVERSGRAGSLDGLAAHAYTVFTPLLAVTDEAFSLALSLRAPNLGPADRLHVGTCMAHGIDVIVSADAALGGLRGLRRVDPLDARTLRRVLTDGG